MMSGNGKVKCAVVGARGYSGLALVRALLQHPHAQLTQAYASKTFDLEAEVEEAAGVEVLGEDQVLTTSAEVVFLATPPEVSLRLVEPLLWAGKKVIDISGAFRLQKHKVSDWYAFDGANAALMAKAHYGLVPFAGPCPADGFVSNPGCYATAVQMALVPLLRAGLIDPLNLVIDAKSGTTGAGRKAQEGQLFSEVAEDLRPYRIGRHQHLPEILEGLENFAGAKADLFFSTQLLPIKTGIQAAIFARPAAGVQLTVAQIEDAYATAFAGYDLVKWGALGEKPQLANLTKVVGTAQTRISYEVRDGKLYLFSCIDNLMKGAATQAIENMNGWFDWPVSTGLYRQGGSL